MGWEHRNGQTYYYRKRRQGDRVVSEYVGNGDSATLIALFDAEDREAKWAEAEALRAEQARDREFGLRLDALVKQAKAEATKYLRSLGYHQHKRQWRKRRVQPSD